MLGRRVLAGLVTLLLVGALSGCMESWLQGSTRPTLYLGKPVVVGTQGEVSILVSDMPDGGLSAIQVDLGGMTYNRDKISNVEVVGESGFIVLVSSFADGKGSFMLINLLSGMENGAILKLKFTTSGNVKTGDVVLFANHITLVSDLITDILDYRVPAYYAQ
jgi:hypothetical protein